MAESSPAITATGSGRRGVRQPGELSHQALKARATRESILDSVITLIKESGFSAATSTAIARKAGITWGAVQHHFGNKDEILLAVLERAIDVYVQSTGSDEMKQGTLDQRVSLFVDQVWEHYKSDLYFAFTEIIMATRGQNQKFLLSEIQMNTQLEKHMDTMVHIFDEYQAPQQRIREGLLFAHRFMAGFAVDRILDPEMPFEQIHIQRIKDELLAIFHPAGQ